MLRAWFRISLVVVPLVAAGCGSIDSPTSPSRALPPHSVADTASVPATFQPQALEDSSLNGSAYRLTDVTATSLSFTNNQDTYTLPYAGTTFRRAVLQSWEPTDRFLPAATAYNTGDPFGDTWMGLLQALEGGNVRIVIEWDNAQPGSPPIVPPNPIRVRSFQPIP